MAEEKEEGGRRSSVGDTMHHAGEVLFGGLVPGGRSSNSDEKEEE